MAEALADQVADLVEIARARPRCAGRRRRRSGTRARRGRCARRGRGRGRGGRGAPGRCARAPRGCGRPKPRPSGPPSRSTSCSAEIGSEASNRASRTIRRAAETRRPPSLIAASADSRSGASSGAAECGVVIASEDTIATDSRLQLDRRESRPVAFRSRGLREHASRAREIARDLSQGPSAGSAGGASLARHIAEGSDDDASREEMESIVADIEQDRSALLRLMEASGCGRAGSRRLGAWIGEKLGRVKLNSTAARASRAPVRGDDHGGHREAASCGGSLADGSTRNGLGGMDGSGCSSCRAAPRTSGAGSRACTRMPRRLCSATAERCVGRRSLRRTRPASSAGGEARGRAGCEGRRTRR